MKHHRILALLTALALLCALTVPALAAGDSYEDFLAGFDRWWAERYPGITVEEYMQEEYSTEEELMRNLYEVWRFEQWQQDYLAAHPGVWEELRANAYSYFASLPYYVLLYNSAQDYMEQYELTEDQFRDWMASMQMSRLYNDYVMEQERSEFLTERGGVPGQLNVMVNGKCLTFPEGRPAYARDGAVYVDAETLSQALGSDVAGDETGYAPLRASAEALGCDVCWDESFAMPVVLDPDAIAAEIDKDFTLYNRAYGGALPDSWTYTGTAKASLTLFDTMTGDRTAAATGAGDLILSEDGLSGTVRYDLSSVFQNGVPQPALVPAQDTAELRVNNSENALWLRSPALNDALAANGVDITRDGWLALPLDEVQNELSPLGYFFPKSKTMGQQLYDLVMDMDFISSYPAYVYDSLMFFAEQEVEVMGDGQFTRKGNGYTLTPEVETGSSPFAGLDDLKTSQQSQTLTVKDNGDVDIDTRMRLAWEDSDFTLGDVVEFTCRSTRRGNKVEVVADLHVRNMFQLSVTLNTTYGVAGEGPDITPPEGALALPMEALRTTAA